MRPLTIDEDAAGTIRVPAHVEVYVEVLGVARTVEMLLAFGGGELELSPNPSGRSELETLIGPDAVRALADRAHHLQRRVPLAKPWIAAVLRSGGEPVAAIARRLHVTDVTVRRWLR